MKKILLAATVAAVLSSAATATAASTPASYRAKVNSMCVKGVAAMKAVPVPKAASGIATYVQTEAALGDKLLRQIAAVTPPVSLQPLAARAIKVQATFQSALHGLVPKLRTSANPKQTFTAAEPGLTRLSEKANAAWRRAGLAKCAD